MVAAARKAILIQGTKLERQGSSEITWSCAPPLSHEAPLAISVRLSKIGKRLGCFQRLKLSECIICTSKNLRQLQLRAALLAREFSGASHRQCPQTTGLQNSHLILSFGAIWEPLTTCPVAPRPSGHVLTTGNLHSVTSCFEHRPLTFFKLMAHCTCTAGTASPVRRLLGICSTPVSDQ